MKTVIYSVKFFAINVERISLFKTLMTRNGEMAASEMPMSPLLKLAHKFNCFYFSGLHQGNCRPFIVEGHQVGLVRPDVLAHLISCYPDVFLVHADSVELNPAFRDHEERSAKVDAVLRECRSQNTFVTLKGWREEYYEVRHAFSAEPLLKMDRSATCLFGIKKYGVDINGYVNHPEKGLCIWLQRRSSTKQTWPGKLDNMVGGGLSVGYGILETAIKEAAEEASIPSELIQKLKPAGAVSFFFESEQGLFPNTEFVYDLELPLDFVPNNSDGEVESFELLSAKETLERIFSTDFKTTSCPVVVDFLIRHGLVTPENEPNYPQLIELLHVPLQTLYQWGSRRNQKNGGSQNGGSSSSIPLTSSSANDASLRHHQNHSGDSGSI
ncbi:uncharacterized protein YJR142W isoform X3 [Ischnura elegans]|uniref:uncharacterized protein YJR142W isoform X3 n=1 Tax=Ischnura elegans TaxID=197161 RepID=UPI001ED87035|nr:uncharacterized protein YJR142W isoform X3 [Ischnura elegans]